MNTPVGVAATLSSWIAATTFVLAGDAATPAVLPAARGIYYARGTGADDARGHEERLVCSLRRITGLADLHFRADGSMVLGQAIEGGAATARLILGAAATSGMTFVVEDHSRSSQVHFARLDAGTVITLPGHTGQPLLLWRVHLDFDDLAGFDASASVRAAFDPGFALLHELLHGFGFKDASAPGEVGPLEGVLNRARLELNLPVRDSYFAESLPVSETLVAVRLRFRTEAVRDGRRRHRHEYLSMLVDVATAATLADGHRGSVTAARLHGPGLRCRERP